MFVDLLKNHQNRKPDASESSVHMKRRGRASVKVPKTGVRTLIDYA